MLFYSFYYIALSDHKIKNVLIYYWLSCGSRHSNKKMIALVILDKCHHSEWLPCLCEGMGWDAARCLHMKTISCWVFQGVLHFSWGLLSCCLTLWPSEEETSPPVSWVVIFLGSWGTWTFKLATLSFLPPHSLLSSITAFDFLSQHEHGQ